ncbi:MAG: TauD/TfdA family dioxygenase [Actinomycetota bacterium]
MSVDTEAGEVPTRNEGRHSHRSSVLLLSIDGVAPRHLTPAIAPRLTALARSGASCFRARSVMPTLTLPVHLSMIRGVPPDVHGVTDNEPRAVDAAPSVLAAARSAGPRTAVFQTWQPFTCLWEPDATDVILTADLGYDLTADELVVGTVCSHLRRAAAPADRPEVVFAYFSLPDLVGHEHGWDSAAYREAVTMTDGRLGALLAAVPTGWNVMVTTDHGGHDKTHGTSRPEDMETFLVAAGPQIRPGSVWLTASVLDVAPTVADLAGFDPAAVWHGRSLVGAETDLAELLMDLVAGMADHHYGEDVDMLSHSLQTAAAARRRGGDEDLVLAALLHDLGHVLPVPDVSGDAAGEWGLPGHATVAADFLQPYLPPSVVEPIRLHVEAKRYLVAVDSEYRDRLSTASVMTLAQQGGPLDGDDVQAFADRPFRAEAVLLRKADDDGKVEGLVVPPLDAHRAGLETALAGGGTPSPGTGRDGHAGVGAPIAVDPALARHACRCPECRDPGSDQCLLDPSDLVGWSVVADRPTSGLPAVEREIDLVHADGRRHTALIPRAVDPAPTRQPWGAEQGERLRAGAVSVSRPDMEQVVARRLAVDGVALVTGVPTQPGQVLGVARRLGFVRETNYGLLFDVVTEPDPVNLAYTSLGLPLHTDNPYRDPCPTVQLLHCLIQAGDGGASVFADGLRAAELLRASAPDLFDALTTTPIDFRFYTGGSEEHPAEPPTEDGADDVDGADGASSPGPVDLRTVRPVIELTVDGRVRAVNVNSRSMEAPIGLSAADAARFYEAYDAFNRLLAHPDQAIEITLGPGDLIAFDNRRVLHGRTGFHTTARRHLQGCYIDIDAIRSLAITGR